MWQLPRKLLVEIGAAALVAGFGDAVVHVNGRGHIGDLQVRRNFW